jgi:Flp pilus assembly protein TadD
MSKRYSNILLGLAVLALAACSSAPKQATVKTDAPAVAAAKPAEVDPQVAALYQRAVATLKSGDENNALIQFQSVAEKAPQLAGPFINMGLIHLRKQRYQDAEQALLQATTVKPNDAVAQNHLGIILREQGKFDKAGQAYQQALQIDPNYANAHLNIAVLYDIYLGDLANALQHYEKYQALTDNKDEQVPKWIADVKQRLSQPNKGKN